MRVLYITPPVPHSFSQPCKGSSFLEVSRALPMCARKGEEREEGRSERYGATENAVTLGGEMREDDDNYSDASPSCGPLCLIMSLLMLILPSDASYFIKGLTFACDSRTSDSAPIPSCVQEMSARGFGCERLILSARGAEERLPDLFWP